MKKLFTIPLIASSLLLTACGDDDIIPATIGVLVGVAILAAIAERSDENDKQFDDCVAKLKNDPTLRGSCKLGDREFEKN